MRALTHVGRRLPPGVALDLAAAGLVWLIASTDGGNVARTVAWTFTAVVAARGLFRRSPGAHPAEPYLRTLQRSIRTRERSPIARPDRLERAVVARGGLVLAAALVIGIQGAFPHAPPTDSLPLAPGLHVVASASGGSEVDSAYDHKRYRYLMVAGPRGETSGQLVGAELRFLTRSGWRAPTDPHTSGIVNDPGHDVYAAIDGVVSQSNAAQQEIGTPLYANPAVERALRGSWPVFAALVANAAWK